MELKNNSQDMMNIFIINDTVQQFILQQYQIMGQPEDSTDSLMIIFSQQLITNIFRDYLYCHVLIALLLLNSKRKEMLNISTATYIKKLVKIIYEKEKQIEILKKGIKNTANKPDDQLIDRQIRDQLQYTSTQLKEVNQQINTMERSMVQLEADLDEEINKNIQNQETISKFKSENGQLKVKIQQLEEQIENLHNRYDQLLRNIEDGNQREKNLTNQKMELLLKIRKGEDRMSQIKSKSEEQTSQLYRDIKKYESQIKIKMTELSAQNQQIQLLKIEIQGKDIKINEGMSELNEKQQMINKKNEEIIELNQILDTKNQQIMNKNNEIQKMECNLLIKQNQTKLVNETFTNYKEFYYSINQYIESAYLKYCSQGFLQSSKRLFRQNENEQNRFQATFKKFLAVQNWMEDASSKIQKLKIPEIGIQTIQNLSIIVHSFENKLQNCDLTQKLEKDREDMLKNEELLLDNLQKECEKSYQHDRIKAVELDQMRQILKMTKEVNRELMDEINKKECVISECRKIYQSVLGSKVGQEYKAIKQMLNIKSR